MYIYIYKYMLCMYTYIYTRVNLCISMHKVKWNRVQCL